MDDNVFDAMQMVFAVMIFVIALSINISFFSQARVTAAMTMESKDRETWSTDVEYEVDQTERIVGLETIIPTMYRARSENYKIYFVKQDGTTPLEIAKKDGKVINYITIDDPVDNKGNVKNLLTQGFNTGSGTADERYRSFLDILIGGTSDFNTSIQSQKQAKKTQLENMGYEFDISGKTFYNQYKDAKFLEKLGEYYTNPEITVESMLQNKRVITYVLQ